MRKYFQTIKASSQQGISLVELILAGAAVVFLGLVIANLPSSISSITKSRHTSVARDIASKEVGYLRQQPFAGLSLGTATFADSRLSSLPEATAAYSIDPCPADICTSPEQTITKLVTVEVNWKESGEQKSVKLTTIVGQGGLAP